MKAKPVSLEILAMCCLIIACACLLDVESASGELQMTPCLEMDHAAGEARNKALKKLDKERERMKKTMDDEEFEQWYACEQVKIYKKVVSVLNGKKQLCYSYCKKQKQSDCDLQMEAKYKNWEKKYEKYMNQCAGSGSAKQSPSGPSPKSSKGDGITFHD